MLLTCILLPPSFSLDLGYYIVFILAASKKLMTSQTLRAYFFPCIMLEGAHKCCAHMTSKLSLGALAGEAVRGRK